MLGCKSVCERKTSITSLSDCCLGAPISSLTPTDINMRCHPTQSCLLTYWYRCKPMLNFPCHRMWRGKLLSHILKQNGPWDLVILTAARMACNAAMKIEAAKERLPTIYTYTHTHKYITIYIYYSHSTHNVYKYIFIYVFIYIVCAMRVNI